MSGNNTHNQRTDKFIKPTITLITLLRTTNSRVGHRLNRLVRVRLSNTRHQYNMQTNHNTIRTSSSRVIKRTSTMINGTSSCSRYNVIIGTRSTVSNQNTSHYPHNTQKAKLDDIVDQLHADLRRHLNSNVANFSTTITAMAGRIHQFIVQRPNIGRYTTNPT